MVTGLIFFLGLTSIPFLFMIPFSGTAGLVCTTVGYGAACFASYKVMQLFRSESKIDGYDRSLLIPEGYSETLIFVKNSDLKSTFSVELFDNSDSKLQFDVVLPK